IFQVLDAVLHVQRDPVAFLDASLRMQMRCHGAHPLEEASVIGMNGGSTQQRRSRWGSQRTSMQPIRNIHVTGSRNQLRLASSTVAWLATAAPPILKTSPNWAPGRCMSLAVPVSWRNEMACIETPVAPTGCPFAFKPPDRFTGKLPSAYTTPSSSARWPSP